MRYIFGNRQRFFYALVTAIIGDIILAALFLTAL